MTGGTTIVTAGQGGTTIEGFGYYAVAGTGSDGATETVVATGISLDSTIAGIVIETGVMATETAGIVIDVMPIRIAGIAIDAVRIGIAGTVTATDVTMTAIADIRAGVTATETADTRAGRTATETVGMEIEIADTRAGAMAIETAGTIASVTVVGLAAAASRTFMC